MGRVSRWICSIFCKSSKDQNTAKSKRTTSSYSKSSYYNNRENVLATVDEVTGKWIARDCESALRSSSVDYSHAMAVAAASKTAAEAAVVAAQAAVDVVRLTRSGRLEFDPSRRAAVVIQSFFRGYLARRALRALKALVRLQALVRGNIVRKRAVDQMRRMHALIMAQERAKAIRATAPLQSSYSYSSSKTSHSSTLDPPTPETSEHTAQVKIKRNSSKMNKSHSKTHPRRYNSDEMDSAKNLFLLSDHCSKRFIPYQTPPIGYSPEEDLYLQFSKEIDQHTFYTADSSPCPWIHTGFSRNSSARRGSSFARLNGDYPESYLGAYPDLPNYMAYTKSSTAKLRSASAPKQRVLLNRSTSLKCYSTRDFNQMRFSPSTAS
ncbi:hypothetical protein QQ045_020782 [Rhodiola kirilowii]